MIEELLDSNFYERIEETAEGLCIFYAIDSPYYRKLISTVSKLSSEGGFSLFMLEITLNRIIAEKLEIPQVPSAAYVRSGHIRAVFSLVQKVSVLDDEDCPEDDSAAGRMLAQLCKEIQPIV